MTKKLAVILGAGASHQCEEGGNALQKGFRPPITKELFRRNVEFNSIINRYDGVEALAGEIRARLESGEGLEDVLRELSTRRSANTRAHYLQIALYLQELIYTCSTKFITHGDTLYSRLLRLLSEEEDQGLEYMILTLNYDLFVEKALSRHYGTSFNDLDAYVSENRPWQLVKLHGSCDWGYELPNPTGNWPGWQNWIRENEEELSKSHMVMRLPNAKTGIGQGGSGVWYPALAVPLGSVKSFVCPTAHVEHAEHFLKDCENFIIVGMSAYDESIRELLTKSEHPRRLLIANGTAKEGEDAYYRIIGSAEQFKGSLASGYPDGKTNLVPDGFLGLMRDGYLALFIQRLCAES